MQIFRPRPRDGTQNELQACLDISTTRAGPMAHLIVKAIARAGEVVRFNSVVECSSFPFPSYQCMYASEILVLAFILVDIFHEIASKLRWQKKVYFS